MQTFFILLMCIGLSAGLLEKILPKKLPNKIYKECQELSGSEEFTEMIKQLSHHEQIAILRKADAHTALWNEANYANYLKEMQSFMTEVNSHKEALKHPPQHAGHWAAKIEPGLFDLPLIWFVVGFFYNL
jgi:hypothetical protein